MPSPDRERLEASTQRPVAPGARHELIDAVRGFALFGVLLANVVWTTQSFASAWDYRADTGTDGLDAAIDFLLLMFVDFKFYTIFSVLFGLGFAMQMSRAEARASFPMGTYSRRLAILLMFGAVHAVFLWFGDVLHVYALLGFVLILFRRRSDRFVLACAAAIACLAALTPTLEWLLGAGADGAEKAAAAEEALNARRFAAMASGSYPEIVAMNWGVQAKDYAGMFAGSGMLYWYMSVLWKFLLGFVIGRRALLQNAEANRRMFRWLLPRAFAVGLCGNAIMAVASSFFGVWLQGEASWAALLWVPVEIGILAMSTAYVCALALLFLHPSWGRRVRALAPVGRMALTNYLSQSALIVAIFYGVGLGLIDRAGTGVCALIGVAIFGAQMALSAAWLKRFRFGPMEWLWRSLTYGRAQPMRVERRV